VFFRTERRRKANVDHTQQGKQAKQFTRDDCARITAEAINVVLEKLAIWHVVEGIAVFPAGEGVYLVDVVMKDLAAESTWAVSISISPAKEETDQLT
jgi:hypothetical protein